MKRTFVQFCETILRQFLWKAEKGKDTLEIMQNSFLFAGHQNQSLKLEPEGRIDGKNRGIEVL